jgi:hypothetical protein
MTCFSPPLACFSKGVMAGAAAKASSETRRRWSAPTERLTVLFEPFPLANSEILFSLAAFCLFKIAELLFVGFIQPRQIRRHCLE